MSPAEEFDYVTAARAEFTAAFRRSSRGNLWRNYEGRTVTVFSKCDPDGDVRYSWVINDPGADGPRYSPETYPTEQDALDALADELVSW
jgi:hypothetical protein